MGYVAPIFILVLGKFCTDTATGYQKNNEIGYSPEMQNEFINSELHFTASHALMLHKPEHLITAPAESNSTARALVPEARGRLPFMLPVMYNLGVITTLLVVLTFLMFKGLTLGIIILILNLNGKGFKQTTARPVHIHVHGGNAAKPPYRLPWNQIEESNTTDGIYQMFHPRGYYRK